MDEKWFHIIRVRTNCKGLSSIRLSPSDYSYAHHKSHIGKTMYVVITAFAPHDNDFTKGRVDIHVYCLSVGRVVKVVKDSYKRVYKNDRSCHYSKIAANLL